MKHIQLRISTAVMILVKKLHRNVTFKYVALLHKGFKIKIKDY